MHRPVDFYCRIDGSAFASILLVLLLMFEVSLPGPHFGFGQGVELARSDHSIAMAKALRDDALAVSISPSGDVYFHSIRIPSSELENKIRDGTRNGAENKVYVIVDVRTHYADVRPVLATISLAGVEQVGIITR